MFNALQRPTAGLLLTAFLTSQLAGYGCSATPDGDDTVDVGEEALSFDGETLFRGIFFGTGAAAGKLPELWGNAASSAMIAKALKTSPSGAAEQLRAFASIARADGSSAATVDTLLKASNVLARANLSNTDFASRLGDARNKLLAEKAAVAIVTGIRAKKPAFFDDFARALKSGDRVKIDAAVKAARVALVDEWCGTSPRPSFPGRPGNGPFPGSKLESPTLAADVTVDIETAVYLVAVVAVAVVVVAVAVVGLESPNVSRLQTDRFVDLLATRFKAPVAANPAAAGGVFR